MEENVESIKPRIGYIDIAKGIAILCVVAGHVLAYDLYGFSTVWESSQLMKFICSFHMPLFMFLSGLVSMTSIEKGHILQDFYKRFRTLFIPFLVIGSIYSLFIGRGFDFLFDEMKFGYWYLWVLLVFYFLNYFIIGGIKSYAFFAILWLLVEHLVKYVPQSISDIASLRLIVCYFPYFIMGNFVKYGKYYWLFENTFIFLFCILIWGGSSLLHFHYSNYVTTLGAIIVILNICKKIDKQRFVGGGKLLSQIGKQTLFIYLFHYFAISAMVMPWLNEWFSCHSSFGLDIFSCVIPVAAAVFFSLMMKKIIESDKIIMKYIFGKTI